ncbi:MAG TPA: hypothetical protein PLB60_00890 [Candidatus Marinimicrobia bacterium]|jgi:REP element-mobilizing transposase RayT|nr:hypothetical protein [Candidatus Neomarinimicrobiota bacterium]
MVKEYYQRHLPHYHPKDSIFFITFRLSGSIPAKVLADFQLATQQYERLIRAKILSKSEMEKAMRDHRLLRCFAFDDLLHSSLNSPVWLKNPEIAELVSEAICYRHKKIYHLFSYCIMPNHVHMVFNVGRIANSTGRFDKSPYNDKLTYIAKIMHSLKRYTAAKANKILGRKGAFWQHESYDHVIRSQEEFDKIINYIQQNPVKAGLVKNWREWKWIM